MVEYFRAEIDGENAFDHRKRAVHTAVSPSKLYEVLQAKGGTALSVFHLAHGIVEVVAIHADEALSGSGRGGVQPFPEPEDDISGNTG